MEDIERLRKEVKKLSKDLKNFKESLMPSLDLTDYSKITDYGTFYVDYNNEIHRLIEMKNKKYKILNINDLDSLPFWVDERKLYNFKAYQIITNKENSVPIWSIKSLTKKDMHNIYNNFIEKCLLLNNNVL